MIWRRIWISGRRSFGACSVKRKDLVVWEQKAPFLRFSSRPTLFRHAFASVPFARNVDLCNSFNIKKCCFSSYAQAEPPLGGTVEVPLAQTGEGIAECELLKWFVQEGDQVEEFQPLCEVQSDKATMEITSRYKGKVSRILYNPGEIVKVGETLLKMVVEEPHSLGVSSNVLDDKTSMDSEVCSFSGQSSLANNDRIGGVLSTPAVRELAKDYGVNINEVHGTGRDGRVIKEDILKYAANKGKFREPSYSMDSITVKQEEYSYPLREEGLLFEDKTIPLRGFQRSMVKSMTMAAKIPHFHYLEEINCDALAKLKASFQSQNSDPGVKHTYLPFFIKSLSVALSRYPLLNSSFKEESYEVILRGCHNIGVAMDTTHGLVVPNIKKVQSLSIMEVTKELSRLQQLALDNKLSFEDISGGTITVSNIGAIGGKFGSPLINSPEVAIIAMGRITKLPRFADDGSVYPASLINVNIGADHRIVDGATVARFLNEWKLLVERPELLMLHLR